VEWLDDVVEFLDNVVEALWPRTDANSYKQAFGFYPGSFVEVRGKYLRPLHHSFA